MNRPILKSSMLGVVLLACGACASGEDNIDTATSWLGPLHRYERLSGTDDFGVYLLKNGVGRPAYVERVVVQPAEITISPSSDLNAVSVAAFAQIRSALTAALNAEVAKRIPASDSGPDNRDVYEFRAAITNLTVKKKSNAFGQVALEDLEFSFEDAAAEAGLHESRSNARRAVIIEKIQGEAVRWPALRDRFAAFAAQVAGKVAEARREIDRKAAEPAAPAPQKSTEPPGK
jgi:hypothetical protein